MRRQCLPLFFLILKKPKHLYVNMIILFFMLRFAYTSVSLFKEDEDERKRPVKITSTKWDMCQLYKQIELSIINVELIKRKHFNNWLLPKSLKEFVPISKKDCDVFISVMRSFFNYIKENESTLKINEDELTKIIRSVFVVKSNCIISSSKIDMLNEKIKKETEKTDYLFTTDVDVYEE